MLIKSVLRVLLRGRGGGTACARDPPEGAREAAWTNDAEKQKRELGKKTDKEKLTLPFCSCARSIYTS